MTRAPTARRYRMTVSYDGSGYAGWQVQPDQRTIQEALERAVERLTGEWTRVCGSGRTDRGVHAVGQVAHFDLQAPRMSLRRFQKGLNGVLRPDIRVLRLSYAPFDFDARRSARGKEYRYFICNAPLLPPFERLYRAHEKRPLDIRAMRATARRLVGTHDFAAFSANPKRDIDGTVRTLRSLTIRAEGPEVCIIARGDGFLYKMVRSLAGFLMRVGVGEVSPEDATPILDSKRRTAAVPTASPAGLFLWKVTYPPAPRRPST